MNKNNTVENVNARIITVIIYHVSFVAHHGSSVRYGVIHSNHTFLNFLRKFALWT